MKTRNRSDEARLYHNTRSIPEDEGTGPQTDRIEAGPQAIIIDEVHPYEDIGPSYEGLRTSRMTAKHNDGPDSSYYEGLYEEVVDAPSREQDYEVPQPSGVRDPTYVN